jgi:hypothetical protein
MCAPDAAQRSCGALLIHGAESKIWVPTTAARRIADLALFARCSSATIADDHRKGDPNIN